MGKNKRGGRKAGKKAGAGGQEPPAGMPPAMEWEEGGTLDPEALRALSQAQEMVYDAWEAPTRRDGIRLARQALRISPDCADAYNFLAAEAAKFHDEALELYGKAVAAAERVLGSRPFEEDVGHFWMIFETRPYMRARAGQAQCLWKAGESDEAVAICRDLLRLNPGDNQGVRYWLMPWLIELGRDREAETLYREYADDGTAAWAYARALLDFRKWGDSRRSRKSLQAAMERNRYVPSYLLGKARMPRYLPDAHGFGDEDEAVWYNYENGNAWRSNPEALQWLAAVQAEEGGGVQD